MSKKSVEIEFIMRDKLSDGLGKVEDGVQTLAERADRATANVGRNIQAQKAVADHLTQELGKVASAYNKLAPSEAHSRIQAQLEACTQTVAEERAALEQLEQTHEKNESATQRLTSKLRLLQNTMAELALAGKKNTAEYRAMAEEAGVLADTIGDTRQQTRHLANDDANLAAFADGLNGIAGGFTAATGMMSLFASENEDLMKVQAKLQAVMAITMGMQQVYNTLNKDSAFNTILVSKAKAMLTAANARLAVALGISTAAATALMATLTLGLSAAITAAIVLWEKFSSAQEEAAKKMKEMQEIERSGREESLKAQQQLEQYIALLQTYRGDKEKEGVIVDELNGKYGEAMGYYDTAAQWYDVLTQKAQAYTHVLFLQAKMAELAARAAVAQVAADEIERSDPDNSDYSMGWFNKLVTGYGATRTGLSSNAIIREENLKRKAAAKKEHEDLVATYKTALKETQRELIEYQKANNIGFHVKPTKTGKNTHKNTAEERAKKIAADRKILSEALKKAYQEVEDQAVSLMQQEQDRIAAEAERLYNEATARITEEAANKRVLLLKTQAEGQVLPPNALASIDAEERQLKAKAKELYENGLLAAMREGYAKQKKEAELQHQRTLEQIEKETKEQKELYARLQKNGANISPEQLANIEALAKQRISQANAIYEATTASLQAEEKAKLDERTRQNQEALNAILGKYQDYATQRAAITKQYGEDEAELLAKRTEANASAIDAAIAQLRKSRIEALQQIDTAQVEDLKKHSDLFKNLFSGMADKTRREVQAVIAQMEQLVAYLQNKNITPTQRADMAKALGITPEALGAIENSPEKIDEISEAIKRLKGTMASSPFQKFTESLGEAIKKLNSGDIEEGIAGIVGAVKDFAPHIKQFGSDLGTIFGDAEIGEKVGRIVDAVEGLGTTARGVGRIMAGDVVGGTMAVASGVAQMVKALDGLFGANYDKYNAAKKQYEDYMAVLDGVIERHRKMVESLDATNALKSYEYAKKLVEGSAETARQLGRERLNAGASAGSHSIGVRQRKKFMNAQAWAEAREALGSAFDTHKIGDGRMIGLFDLSIAQMEKLRDEAPMFWAKLDGDVRKYMEDIIKSGEGVDELKKSLTENLTATSFDSLYDSFLSTLEDMSKGTSDFADDFQQKMQKAVLSSLMKEKVEKQLKAWHEHFAKANEDSRLSDDELLALRKQWDDIVQGAISQRNTLMESMGMANTTAQQAKRGNSFATLTQEQGTKLEGLFTAGQIHWAAINHATQAIAKDTTTLATTLMSIKEDTLYLRHLKTINQYMEGIARDGLRIK